MSNGKSFADIKNEKEEARRRKARKQEFLNYVVVSSAMICAVGMTSWSYLQGARDERVIMGKENSGHAIGAARVRLFTEKQGSAQLFGDKLQTCLATAIKENHVTVSYQEEGVHPDASKVVQRADMEKFGAYDIALAANGDVRHEFYTLYLGPTAQLVRTRSEREFALQKKATAKQTADRIVASELFGITLAVGTETCVAEFFDDAAREVQIPMKDRGLFGNAIVYYARAAGQVMKLGRSGFERGIQYVSTLHMHL